MLRSRNGGVGPIPVLSVSKGIIATLSTGHALQVINDWAHFFHVLHVGHPQIKSLNEEHGDAGGSAGLPCLRRQRGLSFARPG